VGRDIFNLEAVSLWEGSLAEAEYSSTHNSNEGCY
jgi:hypothetical protein